MEILERVRLFADTDELDGLLGDAVDRQRGAAAGVTVELRQDDAGEVERLVKALRDLHGFLTRHAVGDKEDFVRTDRLPEPHQLGHQFVVDL